MKNAYLTFYNLAQFIGWSIILVTQRIDLLCWFQTIQLIEVVHCLLGLVKSSAVTTLMQISSRILVLWAALIPYPEIQSTLGFKLIIMAWPLAETTRYIYYALNLISLNLYLFTWMRYTFFIGLYPMGVSGELLILYHLFTILKESGKFSYPLPNPFNVSVSAPIVVALIMISYIPLFPQMYMYMLSQRKKFLGPAKKEDGMSSSSPAKAHKGPGQRQKSD